MSLRYTASKGYLLTCARTNSQTSRCLPEGSTPRLLPQQWKVLRYWLDSPYSKHVVFHETGAPNHRLIFAHLSNQGVLTWRAPGDWSSVTEVRGCDQRHFPSDKLKIFVRNHIAPRSMQLKQYLRDEIYVTHNSGQPCKSCVLVDSHKSSNLLICIPLRSSALNELFQLLQNPLDLCVFAIT